MKKVELFEHNEIAYKKLIKSLENNKCTTINHATGTGKSFIMLKYLYENRDKKVLYIAPTYPIIDQIKKSAKEIGIKSDELNMDTIIYRSLLTMDMNELYKKYDVIVFDEYHRTGATETFKKIKELKLLLSQSNDNKKFIGLTATPIRYLDDERNMTEEIFDGNVASTLSIAEAMLEEILPVPLYIVLKSTCKGEVEKVYNNIQKLAQTEDKENLLKKVSKIYDQTNEKTEYMKKMINTYIKKTDGKYIVFCNNIDEIEKYYNKVDEWFQDFPEIKKYKVHSRINEEKNLKYKGKDANSINRATIKDFEKNNNGISLLFCVDILNEGVHVHGIDGIFMLRKTMSPIIYFQQIGRCLSFSGRKRQIQIFDMVNNFNNHDVIKTLYEEVQEEYKKKLKENPENKEKYESVLSNFKILDETKAILKQIGEIKEKCTTEKIIESKIDYSIEVLKEYSESERAIYRLFENPKAKNAYNVIANYDIYVDNEQFKELLDLEIILPEKLSMTMEERLEMLGGFNTIREKKIAENSEYMKKVIEFVKENSRIPRIASNELEEKKLAKIYLEGISSIDKNKRMQLENICTSLSIKLTPIEKILFNKPLTIKDISTIINLSEKYLSKNKEIPEFLIYSIEHITRKYDIKENEILFELMEKSKEIRKEKIELKQKSRYELISKIENFLEIHINDDWEKLESTGILDIINKMSKRDVITIRRKYEKLKKYECMKRLSNVSEETMEVFCRKLRLVENESLGEFRSKILEDKELNEFTMELLIFMEKNNDRYPSTKSENKQENNLAIKYNKYMEDDKAKLRLKWIKDEIENRFYNPKKILYKISFEQKESDEAKVLILEYLDFFQNNGRKPLINSCNEKEKELATQYKEKCLKRLNAIEIRNLNSIFNKRGNFQKACEQYFDNIKKSEGVEPTD